MSGSRRSDGSVCKLRRDAADLIILLRVSVGKNYTLLFGLPGMQRECRDVSDVRSVCRYTLTIEKHDVHANANREIREKL